MTAAQEVNATREPIDIA